MTPPRWLFWHRRDLRLSDNKGLTAAAAATPAVTGVFVLDPAIISEPGMAPARLWFLSESLRELQQAWLQAGSRLLILSGDPAELLPRLATALGAEVVAWNKDVEPLGRERDRQVARALQADGRKVLADWDQLLVPPEAIKTGAAGAAGWKRRAPSDQQPRVAWIPCRRRAPCWIAIPPSSAGCHW